ncbi:MAG: (2Fe-2S)-binding protein [Caulobacterales bacterium]
MYVCNCNGLRKREAQSAIENGACSPQHVHRKCGVKTQCGLCYEELRQMIQASALKAGELDRADRAIAAFENQALA